MSYNPNEDSDDEEKNSYQQYEIKDGIIFLIEVTPDLLAPRKGLSNKSKLYEILTSINELMSDLIITQRNTGVGIYLYNCELSPTLKSMKSAPGFNRLFRLSFLNLTNMKHLNDLLSDDKAGVRPLDYYFKYSKPSESENLPVIFNKILDELINRKEFNRKKVIWLTTNDEPYTQKSTKEALWRIINDYYAHDFFIRPIFLSKDSSEFDMTRFRDIFLNTNYLNMNKNETTKDGQDPSFHKDSSIFRKTVVDDEIKKSIFRAREVRRIQFACDIILSDGGKVGGNLGCSVKGYTICSHERYKRDLLLYTKGETLKRVFTDSNLINADTNEVIVDKEKEKAVKDEDNVKEIESQNESTTCKGHLLAGGEIVFLKDEIVQFMTNYAFDHTPESTISEKVDEEEENEEIEDDEGMRTEDVTFTLPPYLKLLGFRSLDRFNASYNSQAPMFVTPDLSDGQQTSSTKGGYQSSFTTFSSLYQSCVKLKKYGVLFGCIRKNAKPSLWALYPTRVESSSRNIKGEYDFPEGFLLIKLAFLDDIRCLPNHFIDDKANRFTNDEDNLCADEEIVADLKDLFRDFYYESYNPDDFPNPSLNYFYKIIKHELLQIELSEEDKKLVNNDQTAKKLDYLKEYIHSDENRLNRIKKINYRLQDIDERAPKRALEDDKASKPPAKKAATAPELDEGAILVAWKNDEWHQFTVPQLRGFQKKYKDQIKSATKKQDLIDNIKAFLDSRER
ncbi:Ku family DNA binding and repair protein [Scheffersomyces xylosifermentans]|uniref:Ku family DNA binding and repair protein n=1 Tax=Scheffersomyces xylosifermentans TaxID=1304137 RepID=UPI00315D5041